MESKEEKTNSLAYLIKNADSNTRKLLGKKSLYMFALIYFGHYFTHKSPQFHFDMCKTIQNTGYTHTHQILIGFRGCAKTSFGGKIETIRRIVYNLSNFIIFGSFDEDTAKDNLFDIARELQENQLIIKDFGQLYFEDKAKNKVSKKTGIGNFLTRNNVRVQATSIKKSVRGKMFAGSRPDFAVFDDFENNKTKGSFAMTSQTILYFDEMIAGLAPAAGVIYNCNRISDNGSVAWLEQKCSNNRDYNKFEISIYDNDGKITWSDKYVETDEEADRENTKRERFSNVISLETLKRNMNRDGRKVFEQEMMNQPIVDGDRMFKIEIVDKALERANQIELNAIIDGHWKIYSKYKIGNEYRIGVDVAEGVGMDSSVIQVLDITTGEQVAEYSDKNTNPNTLTDELIQASINYGNCSVGVERNGIGTAIIALFKERGEESRLTTHEKFSQVYGKMISEWGWQTTAKTKPKMLFDFKRDFEEGSLIINSTALLREMRGFSLNDLSYKPFHVGIDEELTNHFDRIMAMAICNQVRQQYKTSGLYVTG